MRQFLQARDVLLDAKERYARSLVALKSALDIAASTMGSDKEVESQISTLRAYLSDRMPKFDLIEDIAKTLSARACALSDEP